MKGVCKEDMKVIYTINKGWEEKTFIEMCDNGIHDFRINAIHMDVNQIFKFTEIIKKVDKSNNIYFDLPGRKARLWYARKRVNVLTGTKFRIMYVSKVEYNHSNDCVQLTGKEEFDGAEVGDCLVVRRNGRVDVELEVENKSKKYFDVVVKSGGILGWGYQIYNKTRAVQNNFIAHSDWKYISLVNKIPLDCLAISFADNAEMVKEYIKEIHNLNKKIKIFAKIETKEGISNAEKIIDICNGLIIGRDDMQICYNKQQIEKNVEYLLLMAKKYNKIVIPASNYFQDVFENRKSVSECINYMIHANLHEIEYIYCNETNKYDNWKKINEIENKIRNEHL